MAFWTYTYIVWQNRAVPADIDFVDTQDERYFYWVIEYDIQGDFKYNYLLVVIVVSMWGRFLLMLQLTKQFGPMLRIIITMISEVVKFLCIWMVVLFL